MTVVDCTAHFSYFLLAYLVTSFKQVYLCQFLGVLAELVANFTAGLLLNKLGTKLALIVFFGISVFGSILMIFYGLEH